MSAGNEANLERLHELLAARATQRLETQEVEELRGLLSAHPGQDEFAYDRAAAASELSWLAGELEPMPDSVRAKVEVKAVAWLAERKGLRLAAGDRPSTTPTSRQRPRAWLPWLVAAACLILAVVSWWVPRAALLPSVSAQRLALLEAEGTSTIEWADNNLGVTGDVVWNNDRQTGFLRFRGMIVNDPTVTQYQLWIFDETRRAYSDIIAVNGGVFDIDRASGDVVIPISAKLPVKQPVLFAVTTEPPGGVVQHNAERDPDRYRIILTAPL